MTTSMGLIELGVIFELVWALAAGVVLGFFYYGGLWWTIRRLSLSRQPGLLFLGSFMLRTVVVVAGLFVVTGASWLPLVLAMFGFLVVRFALVHKLGPDALGPNLQTRRRRNHGAQS